MQEEGGEPLGRTAVQPPALLLSDTPATGGVA